MERDGLDVGSGNSSLRRFMRICRWIEKASEGETYEIKCEHLRELKILRT
jgi:hypothetical protein